MQKPFVIIDPYQFDDLALGVWSDELKAYLFGDGDYYSESELKIYWTHATFLSWSELEERIRK